MTDCNSNASLRRDRERVESIRRSFVDHICADKPSAAARRWRTRRFDRGLKLAEEIENRCGSLAEKRVLEIGSAFGGDACALAAVGAQCVGTDKFDHQYARLVATIPDGPRFVQSDCTVNWPFADGSFDIVISFSVIELVPDLDQFFSELVRVLKPGGVALVDTGTALRMARNDPIYHLPAISLLPTPFRRFIAERIFRRKYKLPVADHTFYSVNDVKRFVAHRGCRVTPVTYRQNRWIRRVSRLPGAALWKAVIRNMLFDFVLIATDPTRRSQRG